MSWCFLLVFVFFFKQKTAYEMRISDWSSDVCSSDLSPYGLTLAALLACGTGAAILILSRRAGRDRQVPGRIAAIHHYPGVRALETIVDMGEGWPGHRPGQFAFAVSDPAEGPHPYTIASAWREDERRIT